MSSSVDSASPTWPTNQEGWESILRFFEDIVNRQIANGHEDHHNIRLLVPVIKTLSQSEKAPFFRAGQSVLRFMISTTPYNGLKEDDYFVQVKIAYDEHEAPYLKVNYFHSYTECMEEHDCTPETVFGVLDKVLERLWTETKNTAPPWIHG